MKIIADLQIHSKYARATSKDLSLANLEKYARIKGIGLLGTGDFQHPKHYNDIKEYLKKERDGILYSETGFPFLWQTEVSLMFSQGGKRRAVHLLVYAPDGKTADMIIEYLGSKGRLDYDGRPIFGISCRDLVKDLTSINEMIEIVPAHCMTPWFGVFGSDSGFDSLADCFLDQTNKIHAVESGMSADPSMLWRFDEEMNIVSFSDAHSFWPWRIGREATIFEVKKLTYNNIIGEIRSGNIAGTIETYPEYGKYHYDGHRACKISCSPEETRRLKGLCPVCGKQLTIGVEYRVEQLARRDPGYTPKNAKPFYKLLPLHELISFVIKSPLASKRTWAVYNDLIGKLGNEFHILIDSSEEDLKKAGADPMLVQMILLSRSGELRIKPGSDGEYGIIEASESNHVPPNTANASQRHLF